MDIIEIVKLPPEDWPVYKQIRLEALRTAPQAFGSSYEESLRHPDAFWQARVAGAAVDDPARQENWLLFARLGSKVVGTIGAYIPDPAADAARIVGVYVTPAARGKGVGKKLLQAIIAELARCGRFRRLTLSVNPQQAAALALYRSFGFEVAAVETTTMGDGKEYPEYEMERAL